MNILLALVAAILMALASLVSSVGGSGSGKEAAAPQAGGVVTQSRSVSDFDEIELDTIGTLTITQGKTESLTVTAEPTVLAAITTDVVGNKLTIGIRPDTTVTTTKPVTYNLTVKDLKAVTLAGSGDAVASNIKVDNLTVELKGSGGIKLDALTAQDLSVSLSGAGRGEASGQVTREDISISGSGAFDGGNLASDEATIGISGSGSVTVRVQNHLDVRITGSGGVRYIGNPTVSQSITGAGRVQQIG